MLLADLSHSWLSLLSPLVAIGLAIVTRRVTLSLFLGAITGILLLTDFSIVNAFLFLAKEVGGLFWLWDSHQINIDKVCILLFLLLLGAMYSLINFSGGTIAFSEWMALRVNSPKKAQLATLLFGFILFIDDYFNALVVGNTCRPMTDRQHVSRAKLAYIIDSTSAPICVIAPLSSWGAYIISLLAAVMLAHGVTDMTPFMVFLEMIPLNFYAMASLGLVFMVVFFRLDIFSMVRHEQNAAKGVLFDEGKGIPPGSLPAKAEVKGHIYDLLLPILILTLVTIVAMVLSGADELKTKGIRFSLIGALEHTSVGFSLLVGAVAGFLTSVFRLLPHKVHPVKFLKVVLSGIKAMSGAIVILLLAWLLVEVISHTGTGAYLASFIIGAFDIRFLPALTFLVAFVIAFATGSSWGAFGIMIPISANLAISVGDPSMFVPVMAATAAGGVFGDHCSPISDTTVLSSIGAGCHHMDHVVTQFPYSLLAALVALIGYIVMGFSFSTLLGALAAMGAFILIVSLLYVLKIMRQRYRSFDEANGPFQ